MSYSDHYAPEKKVSTPKAMRNRQGSPIVGKEETMTKASDGCYVFETDKWTQLSRFLILGSEGGSYYASENKLTLENVDSIKACIQEDGIRTVNMITAISNEGRAPKNDPALFALALCTSNEASVDTKKAAFMALPKVARIGTHLFHFAEFAQGVRGWGKLMKRGFGDWYQTMNPERLALQLVKYQQRDGWSHRDILRLAKPVPKDEMHNSLYRYATKGVSEGDLPQIILGTEKIKTVTNVDEAVKLILDYRLPREVVPTQFLKDPKIWEALLPSMPLGAMVRNLRNMGKSGLLAPMTDASKFVVNRITDQENITKSRIHPLNILNALMVYKNGCDERGNDWPVVSQISNALDQAFYMSFGNVESTGKNWMLALDVSGSMTWSQIAGCPGLNPREASAAMALITANVEPNHCITAFCHKLEVLDISPRMRLDDVIRKVSGLNFGSTDCSLPMRWAMENNMPIETFAVYTDSETNHHTQLHPSKQLERYRQYTDIPARLAVVGMVANRFSVADKSTDYMLDIVGFDSSSPFILSEFGAGKI